MKIHYTMILLLASAFVSDLSFGQKQVIKDLQINGGTPATGKVLTSDAVGNATWQTPSASVPNGTTVGQTLIWNGSAWVAQAPAAEVDGIIGNEVNNATSNGGLTLSGSGTTVAPYTLGITPGTAVGQVITWNGTAWVSQAPAADVVTTLVNNGDGTYTYTSENGTTTNINSVTPECYGVKLTSTGNQSVNTAGNLTFENLALNYGTNSASWADLANDRIIIGVSGYYEITASVQVSLGCDPAQVNAILNILINGAGLIYHDNRRTPATGIDGFTLFTQDLRFLNAGDIITLSMGALPACSNSILDKILYIKSVGCAGGNGTLSSDGDAWAVTGEDVTSAIGRTGNVGIGTSTPTGKLDVVGSTDGMFKFTSDMTTSNTIGYILNPNLTVGQNVNFQLGQSASLNNAFHTVFNYAGPGSLSNRYSINAVGGLELFSLLANGNVGIGTSTPGAKLSVEDASSSNLNYANFRAPNLAPGNRMYDFIGVGGVANNGFHHVFNYVGSGSLSNRYSINTLAGGEMISILASGNVGIGTTAPASQLDVVSNGTSNVRIGSYLVPSLTAGNYGYLSIGQSYSFNNLIHLGFFYDGAGSGNNKLIFSGFGATGANWVTYSASGNFGIGTGTTNNTQKLTVFNGSTTGTYTTTGWVHSSDARLKENVTSIENPLEKVMQLKGVYYNWKGNETAGRQVGFLAQDAQKILPEVVVGTEGDIEKGETLGMAYQNIVPVLVEAMKEQQAQINKLTELLTTQAANMETLKAQNNELSQKINQLGNQSAAVVTEK